MEPSPSDSTPQIPGIDTIELMERIGDDPELFWDILSEFGAAYRDTPAQIAAALDRDIVEAKQLAHTLKGVLGNLGASELFATCKALDEAIRQGQSERYPALVATLARELPALCDAIDRARPVAGGDNAAAARHSLGPQWLDARYAALRAALEGHRARDCKAIADEIAATALPAGEQAFFDAVQTLVRAYRFKDAHSMLDRRSHAD
jgi:HPt (histidine-containing phosphotransfer) domain-containing protein